MNEIGVLLYKHNDNHLMYVTTVLRLIESKLVKPYKKQRSLQKNHINEIKKHQIKYKRAHGNLDMTGTIILAQIKPDPIDFDTPKPDFSIIDGQHRFYALKELIGDGYIDDCEVIVELFLVDNENQKFELFRNINLSEPVPVNYIKVDDIVNDCATQLMEQFPNAFSTSTRIRRPKISVDKFKSVLIKKEIVKKGKITNTEELVEKILNLNDYYRGKGLGWLCDTIARKNKSNQKVIQNNYGKCENETCLFLGLFQNENWINDICK